MTAKRLTKEELLRGLVDALSEPDGPAPEPSPYYWQGDSPLGRERHLRLVRCGELEGFEIGRRVFVRRDEVHTYIEKHPAKLRPDVKRTTGGKVSTKDTAKGFLKGVGI
jgi:hypothetical protein